MSEQIGNMNKEIEHIKRNQGTDSGAEKHNS